MKAFTLLGRSLRKTFLPKRVDGKLAFQELYILPVVFASTKEKALPEKLTSRCLTECLQSV